MNEITNNDVLDFLRILVNLGNGCHLDESDMTIDRQDGQKVCIPDGDQVKPIQILFNGQVRDETKAVLNPFKMVEGDNPAFNWFYMTRAGVIGIMLKRLILKIVEIGYTKETEGYDCLTMLSTISEQCDKTMVDELTKINASDFLRIFYNKKTKTAEAQTLVFTDAIEEQYKSFRKKTWHVLATLMRTIFNLETEDTTLAKYKYRATLLNIPMVDAELHVMGALLNTLGPLCRSLLKTDLQEVEFNKHLENLETYARMYAWFTAKVSKANNTSVVSNGAPGVAPAWNTNSVPVINASAADENKISVSGPGLPQITPSPVMTPVVAAPALPTIAPTPQIALAGPAMMPAMQPQPMLAGMMPTANPMMPQMGMPGMMSVPQFTQPAYGPSSAEENRISVY